MTELDSKCARGINGQLLKTLGADVLLSWKKLRKTLGGVKKAYQTYFSKKKLLNRGAIFAVEVSKEPMKVEYRA